MTGNRSIHRDIAAMAGGLAVGILGSRLMAPMFAAANGAMRARLGEDSFELLIQDHRHIISTLEEMERAPGDSLARRARLFLTLKRTLAKHALAEEDVVYPLLHQEVHDVKESKRLYNDHADAKIALFELERLLKNKADWTVQVRSLRELLQKHIREEEDVEFPKLRRMLSERKSRRLSGLIHREEALVL
jgi:iron-sulfur cluster repair protein YtfE (RIC family)